MELLHQPGEIINERYRILSTLGQGGVGITYEAEDLHNSQRVALKAVSLRRMTEWKKIELFEREARILAQLNHPAIPQYLDYFQVDTPQDRCFYIAQQLAPGQSLAVLVENGWQPDEAEARRLAIQVLSILAYLHSHTPPVIHRDIKPQNIIRGEDGQVFLVDFGAVADTYHNTITGGSTVVGTYGYMAPEQFRGQAALSTDLYGLGTTLLFLLTGKSPADLPQRKLKIDFRPHVRVSKDFADWLEKMLEPAIANRFPSANVALAVLQGQQAIASYSVKKPRRPKNSAIALTKTEEQLVVKIPPGQSYNNYSLIFAGLLLIGNSVLLLILWTILQSSSFSSLLPSGLFLLYILICRRFRWRLWKSLLVLAVFLIVLFSLSNGFFLLILMTMTGFVAFSNLLFSLLFFWLLGIYAPLGLRLLNAFILSPLSHTRLTIYQNHFSLQQWFQDWDWQNLAGSTSDIRRVELKGIRPITVCALTSWRQHYFGSFLTQPEKEWLMWEIRAFLEKKSGAW
jgi:eukaryotic-like serine/threonine-protein kinase